MTATREAMWRIIRAKFPDAILTSAFRQGDPDYHGKGQAIDIACPYSAESARMLKYARWIGTNHPESTQLAHIPGRTFSMVGRSLTPHRLDAITTTMFTGLWLQPRHLRRETR